MNRRGISTVVGAVFFIIIFTTAVTFVTYDMNLLNNFTDAFVTKSQADADANHEEFSVTKVTVNNNKFNITVQNSGNIPITISRMWVQNKTDVTWGTSKYDVSQVVYPGNSLYNIGQSIPLYVKSTQGYDLKLVTMRGNTKEFFVNSASQAPVYLQLFALPNSGPNNFNTTLLLGVTNNMTNGGALSNIQANMVVKNVTGFGKTTLISGPTPTSYPLLSVGDVTFFKWDYKINGTTGYKVNFQASLQNGYLFNNASQNVAVNTASILKPQINFTAQTNRTGTSSLVGVMLGPGTAITPQTTGRILIQVSGYASQNTAGDGCVTGIRYGTGADPINAATLTGTLIGSNQKSTHSAATTKVPFAESVQVQNLAINTRVWVELSEAALTGGTCTINNVNWSVLES
ncbi:MAG TPA: hypothetical protein VFA69_10265 [Candidatus Nitrosotalea sp.]|nr:hypothetical protein [Candidatus Nitrosotalea sp.]